MFNLAKFKQKGTITDDDLIRVHHTLMKTYGWIPIAEFKKLPAPTIANLLNCIQEDNEKEEKALNKSRRK